jgi:outer membrane protein assembly factor BamE (lipoprotein component of BamABCDE complex)
MRWFLVALLALSACMSAQQHQAAVANGDGDRLTVAAVQRELRTGMSGDEVVRALGAPNIVTTDEQRQETWIYDRFATDGVYSTSSEGLAALILGGASVNSGSVAGAAASGIIASGGAHATRQRTLTILVKFDAARRVRDFAYRQSSF